MKKRRYSGIMKTRRNRAERSKKMEKRQYTAEYKARIVLEVIREEKSIGEIASRENINRTQLQKWKKEFEENANRVFAQSKTEREAQQQMKETAEHEQELMAKVGQLTMENEWLKKKSAQMLGVGWEDKIVITR